MTAEHNHPPRCCCPAIVVSEHGRQPAPGQACPSCPEHGALAPSIECPQCHQTAGRPHTDYCTLNPNRVWADMGSGPGYPAGDPPSAHAPDAYWQTGADEDDPSTEQETTADQKPTATCGTPWCDLNPGHQGTHARRRDT